MGFSDALDSFEREKKDSVINNLSSQELLKLESIKHRRDQWEKSLHDMLVIHDPALLQRWDDAKARQKLTINDKWKRLKPGCCQKEDD